LDNGDQNIAIAARFSQSFFPLFQRRIRKLERSSDDRWATVNGMNSGKVIWLGSAYLNFSNLHR
jgi:hypothetical protein